MGATPTTSNTLVNVVNGLVNAAITGGKDAAQAFITVEVPWLEWPVIRLVTNAVISALGDAIASQTKNLVDKVVIDVQTNMEASAAAAAVQQIQQANASGDQSAITSANSAFDNAMAGLLHGDGSAS